jgi:hypothetical protein
MFPKTRCSGVDVGPGFYFEISHCVQNFRFVLSGLCLCTLLSLEKTKSIACSKTKSDEVALM